MATKSKQAAPEKITLQEAQSAAESYQQSGLRLAKLESLMTEKIAKVRSEFQAAVNKDKALLAASEEILRAYAEQQKDEWPTKAADLTFCVVGFRKGSQKVVLPEDKTEEQALADIKKNKVLAAVFVAVTESIDRKAILGCKNDTLLKKLNTATGVHVGREPDRFYIKPKTEEVTA